MGQDAVVTNSTGGGRTARKPHAVVVPYPLQGHVIPAAHLALRLAARGFAVTFVNTESVHHQTVRALGVDQRRYDIFAGARAGDGEELDVRYELVSDGFPLGFDRSLNHDQFMEGVLHVLPAHVDELLRRVVVDPGATCLVADTFFVWPATLARRLGVPYVSFWTEPALIFTLYYHMDLLAKKGHFKCQEADEESNADEASPNQEEGGRAIPFLYLPSLDFTEVAGGGSAGKPHVVVVAYPLQGHVIPVTHLALRLAARGFAVTFVSTEAVHHQTARALGVDPAGHDVFAAARASGDDVRYELVSDGLPVGFDRSLNHDDFMGSLLHALPAHVEELLRRVVVNPASTFLVADTFFVWPATLASRLGIAYVSFWTEPALIFNLYYHVDLLAVNGHFGCNEPRKDTITYIPGVPAIEPAELMSYLQETNTSTVVHRIIFKAFEEAHGADYVLCNTVEELESSTIAALRAEKPFYAVGPIFPANFARSAVATSMWAESDCSHWLDAQPAGSVLYISFGSYAHVTKQELHEIAGGVLASGARFLWVMRPDIVSSDDPDPLPEGFAAAAAGRGVVVPWCCQVEVLSHAAVGGFLTHCGWNSVLESVWAGVPMLCFPLLTDQITNRRLVAREWRVGVSVGDRGAVFADEVRARVEGVMSGKEGEELREELRKVRATLEGAVLPGGSSQRGFDEFIDELTRRCGGR